MADSDELKAMTERAKIAEARVAELLEEQKRIGGPKPLTGSLSAAADDSKLRQRAEAAEAEREDLRAKKNKLEHELEEEEEKLRKALHDLDKAKGDKERIARLEAELSQAREAAANQPPPLDTAALKEQLKSKDDEIARLSATVREKQEALQKAQQAAASQPPPDTSGLEEQLKKKGTEIDRLTAELNKALQEAANRPPPPPPAPQAPAQEAPDTSGLEEQIKSKDEELAGLASAVREKDAVVAELSQRVEAIPRIEAERDGLAKEVESLRAQVEQAKARPLPAPPPSAADPEVVEHLKAELEEMAGKVKTSVDEAQQLTQENLQLLQQMAALKRENDELLKKADEAKDEISIVSQARADDTQPKTLPPRPELPQDTADTVEALPGEVKASWPSGQPVQEVPPPEEPSGEVIVGTPVREPVATPVREPVATPVSEPQTEPVPDDVPEDSLPELEPLPPPSGVSQPSPSSALSVPGSQSEGAALSVPGAEPVHVPRPKKGGFVWKFFLFLILVGGAFFAAWHFYPELFDFLKDKPAAEVAVSPEPAPEPEPAVEPAPEVPEESAEETPEEARPEEPPPPEEEPEDKISKKKSPKKKRTPPKTAKVIEDKLSVSEAKRQIRRLLASKQLGEAQKMLAEWVKKRPRDAGLHYLYGRLFLMQGKKNQAVDQLEEAVEISPKMASAYHDLGAVYLQMGDNESACEALGQFVRLQPDHSRTPVIKNLMKKIKCP